VWKKFHKNYSVSDKGEIRNDKTGTIRKQYENNKGYLRVQIERKHLLVHRVVLETFKGKSRKQVNHKDYIRKNNWLDNLEWMTAKQNAKHRAERKGWSVPQYTEEELKEIPF